MKIGFQWTKIAEFHPNVLDAVTVLVSGTCNVTHVTLGLVLNVP